MGDSEIKNQTEKLLPYGTLVAGRMEKFEQSQSVMEQKIQDLEIKVAQYELAAAVIIPTILLTLGYLKFHKKLRD